jgi:hypothetical protein
MPGARPAFSCTGSSVRSHTRSCTGSMVPVARATRALAPRARQLLPAPHPHWRCGAHGMHAQRLRAASFLAMQACCCARARLQQRRPQQQVPRRRRCRRYHRGHCRHRERESRSWQPRTQGTLTRGERGERRRDGRKGVRCVACAGSARSAQAQCAGKACSRARQRHDRMDWRKRAARRGGLRERGRAVAACGRW